MMRGPLSIGGRDPSLGSLTGGLPSASLPERCFMRRPGWTSLIVLTTLFVTTGCGPNASQSSDETRAAAGSAMLDAVADYGEMGSVRFDSGCSDAAQELAVRGITLLHHMTYLDAGETFVAATEADPNCTIGYWGQAMAIIHPVWPDVPGEEGLLRGAELVRLARERTSPSGRAAAYLATVEAYFEDGLEKTELERLAAFEAAWRELAEAFPDDVEAKALYALSHVAIASPQDKTYEHQYRALELLDDVLEAIPDHPGGHHYVIHARDYPPLAEEALEVARAYGRMAQNIPHALHMPTHIYTRVGLWDESIDGNAEAADAATRQGERLGGITTDFHHSLDYLAYSHLQRGEDGSAGDVMARAIAADGPWVSKNPPAIAYALSAIPARVTMERADWEAAAALETRQPAGFPWSDGLAPFEAITYFAKAVGAARSGQAEAARSAIATLREFEDRVSQTASAAYWKNQIRVQRLTGEAWLAWESGDREVGLSLMREAANLEAATDKHAVTPGEVIPAAEFLGEMLLASGNIEEALASFRTALERSPNRLNGLAGAGRAAAEAGESEAAAEYFRRLLELTATADGELPQMTLAREYLASQ